VVYEVRRAVAHAPRVTTWAGSPAFAGERYQNNATTVFADGFGEAILQQSATQIVTQFLLNVFRQRLVVVVANFSEECFQVLRHYLVEDGLLGLMALVSTLGAIACAQSDRSARGTPGIWGFRGSTAQGFSDHSERRAESIASGFAAFLMVAGVANSGDSPQRTAVH
jgi:hypothetical protein